jgi:glycosyltransferase involved in cell wall biosynthesis
VLLAAAFLERIPFMRIVQTVFGVFHHFDLARELERRGHLERVYSTWPWKRLKREGLEHRLVETYPWLHVAEYMAGRSPIDLRWLTDELGYANALAFDRWTEKRLKLLKDRPDALIGISGSSLSSGAWLQKEGGIFICDRGSTHQRFQQQIVEEEYAIWGVTRPVSDERDTLREEAIYRQANAITVPSSFVLRSFVEMGMAEEKLFRIPYGVRLDNFRPVADPVEGEFHVLFAGAPGLRKGVPYLLEAFANLKHPKKTLTIAGYVQENLKAALKRLPLENVQFLGPISQTEMVERMSRSHVLVLPSIEEGLALVQAEAMACGCPVISSTNSGGDDLYTDDVEGFIVPIRDPKAIEERMQLLADDPNLRREMGAAALRRVHSMGGWKEYGDRWEQLLLQLTTGR